MKGIVEIIAWSCMCALCAMLFISNGERKAVKEYKSKIKELEKVIKQYSENSH